jgi:hypothetical protein
MSLQINPNQYNSINQYAFNGRQAEAQADSGVSGADNSYGDKLLKKIGAIECTTCQNRRYVDGSNDPGVSFKTPEHVSPEGSGAAVRAHEQEHVSREGAKAQAEGRKVVAQSVQIFTDVCPECGRSYVSGGKTTTTTKADNKNKDFFMDSMRKFFGKHYGKYIDTKV